MPIRLGNGPSLYLAEGLKLTPSPSPLARLAMDTFPRGGRSSRASQLPSRTTRRSRSPSTPLPSSSAASLVWLSSSPSLLLSCGFRPRAATATAARALPHGHWRWGCYPHWVAQRSSTHTSSSHSKHAQSPSHCSAGGCKGSSSPSFTTNSRRGAQAASMPCHPELSPIHDTSITPCAV